MWTATTPAVAVQNREGHGMRDFIAQRAHNIPLSGLRKFFEILATMKDVISPGLGEPDFVTPRSILEAGIRSPQEGRTSYTSNYGMLELREALAEHLARLYGVSFDPERELLITVGVSEALAVTLLATIDPGDEVIVVEPCFVSYKPDVLLAGGVPVVVPTRAEDRFQVSASAIEEHITPAPRPSFWAIPITPPGR